MKYPPCERWHLSDVIINSPCAIRVDRLLLLLVVGWLLMSASLSCVYFVWCALRSLVSLARCLRESICLAWNPSASQQRSRLHSFPHTRFWSEEQNPLSQTTNLALKIVGGCVLTFWCLGGCKGAHTGVVPIWPGAQVNQNLKFS